MRIIKRSGVEQSFSSEKIREAIHRANKSVSPKDMLTDTTIDSIVRNVERFCSEATHTLSVEEIQDIVETELMQVKAFSLAKNYITYRYLHTLNRKSNTTDKQILSLIDGVNEEIKQENSNKNPMIASVQRDYIAGEVSKDISRRFLMPEDIMKAHDAGVIHCHDLDYFLQKIYNCCLVNLDDMLQNGTVISGTKIDKPKSFLTACTITTQIIAQVASSQYGGQSITLTHLAPFVDISRKKIRRELQEELSEMQLSDSQISSIVEKRLRREIAAGVQTIQYQVVTLMTTNGQAPFITVFMYLGEARNSQEKNDLSIIIEEVLKQRYTGVKNEQGVYITPAFPKLVYVLEEQNVHPTSEYYYLTQLAAKCTAKRMVPDYISEKIMKLNKIDSKGIGRCYPCMGCVDGNSLIDYMIGDARYVESFERAWDRLSELYSVQLQRNNVDEYIDTPNVSIYDHREGRYVKQHRIIRNTQSNWVSVKLTGGRYIDVTDDHPFEVDGVGVVQAKDLQINDVIGRLTTKNITTNVDDVKFDPQFWLDGLLICDGCYASAVVAYFGMDERDVAEKMVDVIASKGFEAVIKEQHRGVKGNYLEVFVKNSSKLKYELIEKFEGIKKIDRHINRSVFSATRQQKLSFIAGLIDSDGYIRNNGRTIRVQLGSTNQEFALQQMLLAIDVGLNASVYKNYYKKGSDSIRYRVEFNATPEIVSYLVSEKKKSHGDDSHVFKTNTRLHDDVCSVMSVSDYICEKYSYDVTTESEHFTVNGIWSHNCRSILTPYLDEDNQPKYYGRFNQGVVTLNLPDIALSSGCDLDKFWELLEERAELCHRALQIRHERLEGTTSDIAPILWQHGAIARLEKGEKIDSLLHNGYSTISLGYAGLWECVYALIGKKLTEKDGENLCIDILKRLNSFTAKWKSEEHIDYSLYGTPLESTTYKFAKSLQNRFGVIKGVSDKNYITNSYHVHVTEPIDVFSKLALESKFQTLSPGGVVSYFEAPHLEDNLEAVLQIIRYMYDTIMYAEMNIKSDYCQECGFDGEILIMKSEDGKLIWRCPHCGNTDERKLHVARRTCGYIGSQFWNQGRTQEIQDRVLHI